MKIRETVDVFLKAALVCLGALCVSCGDSAFDQEYGAAKKRLAEADGFTRLVELDQKYPEKLALKIDLGAYCLSRGLRDQALAYLRRGEALAGVGSDDGLKSVLWADLAEAALSAGDGDQALRYANLSLENKDEKLGVIFTRAKAHYQTFLANYLPLV